jgi:RNA polymerase sigma-70 factor (ECF subfamily)
MSPGSESERLLVEQIRRNDERAWQELIDRYEGRLSAFLRGRVGSDKIDDIVQETFIGFLRSLPNYDANQALESYLLSIATHKLTDMLRREGRRPTVPFRASESSGDPEYPDSARGASSLYRSQERRDQEQKSLAAALTEQLDHYRRRGDWEKIQITELLFVRGWANKGVAEKLGVTENRVATVKFEFLNRLRDLVQRQGLMPDDLLPPSSES